MVKGAVIERVTIFPETRLRHFSYFWCLEGCRFNAEDSGDGLLTCCVPELKKSGPPAPCRLVRARVRVSLLVEPSCSLTPPPMLS